MAATAATLAEASMEKLRTGARVAALRAALRAVRCMVRCVEGDESSDEGKGFLKSSKGPALVFVESGRRRLLGGMLDTLASWYDR